AALPKLIARLRARGFRFVPVSQLAGLSQRAVELPASSAARLRGQLFVAMLGIAGFVTRSLTKLVEAVTVLVGLRMLAALILASMQVPRSRRTAMDDAFLASVSVTVPAFDE